MTDTVKIYVQYDPADPAAEGPGRKSQTLELPSWCSGDPASAAALYLWGYADAVGVHNVIARVID